jgi:hypothetical protein
MKMFKGCFTALIIAMVSAFANASVITDIVSPHYELSQEPSDLGVQSDNVNSFELVEAHSEASFQVEHSEAIRLSRFIEPAFALKPSVNGHLVIVSEVGWRRSYNL